MTEQEIVQRVVALTKQYYDDRQYSCTEAMLKAFAEVFAPHRFDTRTIQRLATPFNGGFSELNLTCGALTAGLLVIGLVAGRDHPGDEDAREEAYTLTQIFYQRYLETIGTDSCRELLDRWRDEQGVEKRRCKQHTCEVSELLAKTILQVGFHELTSLRST